MEIVTYGKTCYTYYTPKVVVKTSWTKNVTRIIKVCNVNGRTRAFNNKRVELECSCWIYLFFFYNSWCIILYMIQLLMVKVVFIFVYLRERKCKIAVHMERNNRSLIKFNNVFRALYILHYIHVILQISYHNHIIHVLERDKDYAE
jgi:hypothetical protein